MTKTKKLILLSAVVLALLIAAGVWYLSGIYSDCRMSDKVFEETLSFKPERSCESGILYADEEKAVFYCLDGVFAYNYNKDKITQMINIRKLNCAINEHKQTMGTTIHSDGEKIALINYGDEKEKYNNYLVFLKTSLAKKENDPKLNDKVHSMVMVSWVSDPDIWRSGMCSYVGEEMFYIELNKGDNLKQIKLVAADKNSDARREFHPFK